MARRRYPGEGSIYRRKSDGRWVAAVSEGPRDNRVIRRRYAPFRDNTKARAKALLDEMLAGADPTTETVGSYLGRWVNEARNIRESTRRGYRAAIDTWVSPTLGHIRLGDLSPMHIEQLLAGIEAARSPKTARNVHAVLRRALGQAVRTGLVSRNVAAREFVDAPRVPVEEPRALTEAEVNRLLAVPDRLHALFVLAVDTGLRQGELLGLAWEDIEAAVPRTGAALSRVPTDRDVTTPDDADSGVGRPTSTNASPARGTVHVRRELVYLGNRKYVRGELKTPRSRRDVPLSDRAVEALEQHREAMKAEGFVTVSTGPVFVTTQGRPINGSSLTHHFYDLLAQAGIPRLPFKNLRSTFATRLYERGVSDMTVAQLMGHTRVSTTKKHYIGRSPESAEEAIRRLA